jgi:outer membrane autotransporter protein
VSGSLAFASGAYYMVQVNPGVASFANVSGTATLGGTVKANFPAGAYAPGAYDILNSAGLIGTFSGVSSTNLPAGLSASLSYIGNDVFLDLDPIVAITGSFNTNQQNVATALNNFFNATGGLPPNFVTVFDLTGGALTTALSQLDGEVATGGERVAFQSMTELLQLMLDPFVDGRNGFSGGTVANTFAPEQDASFPTDIALAYNSVLKKPHPPPTTSPFDQRWTAWGSAYGGSSSANGDPVVGSTDVTANTYGFAAGMDKHVTPDTVLGFALAGGGTNWSLAQNLGSGRSDAFQAGVYGTTHAGPAYVAAALAFANHWFTTDRTAPLGDQLTARFDGQSYGARLEAGYRYGAAIGVTPYAALQEQLFHTPSYSETDLTGGGFGLSYNAVTASDTRSELGSRFDEPTTLGAMPVTLRARVAWAHDWVSNPSLGAAFQALPGASFVVNGAALPKDSALTSAGAELHITSRLALLAKFDGEFATGSQTYAGSGTLRYTW